jgi:hypothetical protein
MATFAELLADTYTITNRPDMVNETKVAVKSATLKAHQIDFFPKDLFETGISWSPIGYTQSLDYRALNSRWRALKYLRKYDGSTSPGTPGIFFTVLTPEQVLDSYGIQKEDVCYLAGEMIEIRSSTQDQYMLIGAYLNPDISEATYSSWIALDHPYAIIFDATATIFKMIGFDEQSAQYRQMVAEQYQMIKISNIQAQGY